MLKTEYPIIGTVTAKKDTHVFHECRENILIKKGTLLYITQHHCPGNHQVLIPGKGEYWIGDYTCRDFSYTWAHDGWMDKTINHNGMVS